MHTIQWHCSPYTLSLLYLDGEGTCWTGAHRPFLHLTAPASSFSLLSSIYCAALSFWESNAVFTPGPSISTSVSWPPGDDLKWGKPLGTKKCKSESPLSEGVIDPGLSIHDHQVHWSDITCKVGDLPFIPTAFPLLMEISIPPFRVECNMFNPAMLPVHFYRLQS